MIIWKWLSGHATSYDTRNDLSYRQALEINHPPADWHTYKYVSTLQNSAFFFPSMGNADNWLYTINTPSQIIPH